MRKGVRLPLEALQDYLLAFPQPGQTLDLTAQFGNNRPTELEVGFGKGAFLIATAPEHPEKNYLGVEIDRGLQLYVANRVAKRELTNVRLACGDAGKLLAEHLLRGSLSAIHVYFPDPWWKNRHRKRRVFSGSFAEDCARALGPGGLFFLASDVAEYFQVMLGLMSQRKEFTLLGAGRHENQPVESLSLTNFEKKAYQQGRPVWKATFQRNQE